MRETPRNRIVIDLDSKNSPRPKAQLGKKSRWPRVVAILIAALFGAVILAAGAGFFWWQHYKTTPAYSLALVVDAAQRNDPATIDQFLDTDKIASNLAGQVTEKATSRYGLAISPLVRQSVDTLVPGLLPRIKVVIRDEVSKMLGELAENPGRKPFVVTALMLPYFVNITTTGDTATASLPNQKVDLTLLKNGDRWQIVAINNEAIVQRIVDRFTEELPAIGLPSDSMPKGVPPGLRRGKRRR